MTALPHARLHDAPLDLAMMLGTGTVHVIYFVRLQRSYRASEFSLVCPLARGSGPLITALAAITLSGERLTAVQVAGFAIIVVAIFLIAGEHVNEPSKHSRTLALRRSLGYGVATGLAIGSTRCGTNRRCPF